MSSGFKRMVINTQERAISTDINRLQAFQGKNTAELLRFWLNVSRDDDDLIGLLTVPSTVATPLGAEIVEGLLCKPQIGSQAVYVDAGVAMIMAPDGAADESNYKYIADAGDTSGALTIAAGGGGATRIDVLECRINPVDQIITDNRDIFNPITGLFTATSVTKERNGRLEYRVRQGTAGGGFPANVSGWLPLMVASVPNTSVNNDTVTFWDVRPLISDRALAPSSVTGISYVDKLDMRVRRVSAVSAILTGVVQARLNGRRLGGIIRRGTPGTDANTMDVAAAANQDTGTIAEPLTGDVYLYFATPFGLPRWARYQDSPSARIPRSPKGIPIVSYTKPTNFEAKPVSALALPPSTGLGGTTTEAVCGAVLLQDAGNQWSHLHGSNRIVRINEDPVNISATLGGGVYNFSVADSFWPPNAKAIFVQFTYSLTLAASSAYKEALAVFSYADNAGADSFIAVDNPYIFGTTQYSSLVTNSSGGAVAVGVRVTPPVRIPLPQYYPAAAVSPRRIRLDVSGGGNAYGGAPTYGATANMSRLGYEL